MIPLLLSLALGTAEAKDGPFMWGAGGGLYTLGFPPAFPLLYPGDTNFQATDKVRGDIGLNLRGMAYLNKQWRGAARVSLGRGVGDAGNGFGSRAFNLEVDKIFLSENGASAFVGGGVGITRLGFEPDDQGGAELLVNAYQARAQVGAYYRIQEQHAVELALFGLAPIPYMQTFTSSSGAESQVRFGAYLPVIGVEANYYFGDFRPPKDGKDNKKGKKNKKNK
jgi:hypothetical protein